MKTIDATHTKKGGDVREMFVDSLLILVAYHDTHHVNPPKNDATFVSARM